MSERKTSDADPLQDLLNEANDLMEGLDVSEDVDLGTDLVIDGFAIDGDLDDEKFTDDKEKDNKNSGNADEIVHPLSEEWLAPTSVDNKNNNNDNRDNDNNNNNNSNNNNNINHNSNNNAATSSNGIANPMTTQSPMASASVNSSINVPTTTTSTSSNVSTNNVDGGSILQNQVSMDAFRQQTDAFKQQTTRFASNLANMAQRAANQVAAATNPTLGPAPQGMGTMPGAPPPGVPMNTTTPNSSMELDKEQKSKLLQQHVGDLLPGERIIMFLSNLLHISDTSGVSYVASQSSNSSMWCCAMSYYRLILFSTAPPAEFPCPPDWNPICWPSSATSTRLLEMPLASMDRVDKTVYQANGNSFMGIVISGKDSGRIIRFTTPSYADTGRAYESLNTYAFPGRRNLGYLFAFESKRDVVMASVKVDEATGQQTITIPPTRKRFDPLVEFPRLLSRTSTIQSPWVVWSAVNSTYQLSPTYPSVLVGPSTLDENKSESLHIIRQCSQFRSEQRLPALTWCGVGGASIWRCSQPKIGLQGNRSPADELFLKHVVEAARSANAMAEPPSIYPRNILHQLTGDYAKDWTPEAGCGLKILDLRPRASAMANRTGGYGYENTSNYSSSTLQFCNIGNIHAVRDSYQKLCGLCNGISTTDVSWNQLLEDTKWLSHIRLILAASWETAYWVHLWRMPVLVHCSHGWDRTSQVAALAQLLLDPHYRTREGFAVLVEKDFMSFGHPFHTRCAHGEGRSDRGGNQGLSNDEGQISPIFLQFLDCVYQILNLFPECFEFNADYLLELSNHVYSCRFGSMLCDTEREREMLAGIRQRTYSVWDHLDSDPALKNNNYKPSEGVLLMPLPLLLRNVCLWGARHCPYSPKPTMRGVPPFPNQG